MTFFPDCKTKRGPGGSRWRIDRNFCIALTGQVDVLVEPINTVADFPNLSVFVWDNAELDTLPSIIYSCYDTIF